jgi:hypothetical protein
MVAWPGKSGEKVVRCGQCIVPEGWARCPRRAVGRAAPRPGQARTVRKPERATRLLSSADPPLLSSPAYLPGPDFGPRPALHPRHDRGPRRHRFASRPSPAALVVRPRRPCPGAGSCRLSSRPRARTRSRGARRSDRRDRGLSGPRGPGVSRSRRAHRSDANAPGRRRACVRVSHLRVAPLLQCDVSGHGPWPRCSGTRRSGAERHRPFGSP